MDIAVLVDSYGKTSGFEKDGIVKLYSKNNGIWVLQKSVEHHSEALKNAGDLRRCLNEIGQWLGNCKVIVVNRIRGIHYIAFEEMQISMLQISGYPEEFLDYIQECEHHERMEQEISLEFKAIFEQQPGYFFADLRDIMKGKTSYSSKQLLLPFFEKEFDSLELLCTHTPKWLEKELPNLNLLFRAEQYNDCVKVTIYHI